MTTSGSQARAVLRSKNMMDGRAGFRLRADWGYVSVLEAGGHICELNLNACSGVNPLWRPPWETIDPSEYLTTKHAEKYGEPPDGRLLAGIAGHSLSFDHFGPPSPEETAATAASSRRTRSLVRCFRHISLNPRARRRSSCFPSA